MSIPYFRWELDVNANRLWQVYGDKKVRSYIGAGVGVVGNIIYPKNYMGRPGVLSNGSWGFSLRLINKTKWKLNKISIQNYFQRPIIKGGYFLSYQTFPFFFTKNYHVSYAPNTLAWFGDYIYLNNQLRIIIPYENIYFTASYLFLYQQSTAHQTKERYLQHAF
ncbi:MAG: hypothetical protein ACK5L5_11330 [Bacteroidales bacterium]